MAKKSAKKAAKQKRQAQNQARSRAQAKQNATSDNSSNNTNNNNNNNSKHIQQMTARMENISLDSNYDGQHQRHQLSLTPSGLSNLGSTCYYNSVMQVLGQTYILGSKLQERSGSNYQWHADTVYLEVVSTKKEEDEEDDEHEAGENASCSAFEARFKADSRLATLPEPHALITAFINLQREIFTGSRTFPHVLLGEIRREHAQFMGFSEQDAQELLISLLSSMKKLEAERQKTVLPAALGIEDRRRPTPAEQQLAQRFKIAANHTVVDAIFGGQLLCCIRCTECNHRSFTFETFMDLSLSLNTNADQQSKSNISMKKFANNTASTSSASNSNSRNKGYKNKKNKSNHHQGKVVNAGEEEGEDEPGEMPPLMDAEEAAGNDLDNRQMTPRERKDKRAAKKAAKRQARQNARDQATKDQQGHSALEVTINDDQDDGFKSGDDEEDDEEEEEEEGADNDDDQDSTGGVDGDGPEQHDGNLQHDPMDITGDMDDIDTHQQQQQSNLENDRLLSCLDSHDILLDDNAMVDGSAWGDGRNSINIMDIVGGSGGIGMGHVDSTFPDWADDPKSCLEQHMQNDLLGEVFEKEGNIPNNSNDDDNQQNGDDQTTADSGIGGGGGGGGFLASVTTSASSTCKGSDGPHSPDKQPGGHHHHLPDVDVFASGDSMDGPASTGSNSNSTSSTTTNSPNGKAGSSTKLHNSNTSILLPHVDPAFRAKLYDLALQKVSYGGEANNGDLGRLFEAFIKPETLDGINKYLCDGCTAAKKKTTKLLASTAGNVGCGENSGDSNNSGGGGDQQSASKSEKVYTKAVRTQLIALPPAVLVVHLKRFEANHFGGRSGGFSSTRGASYAHKLSTAISYPERLSLGPYTSKLYEMAYAKFYEASDQEEAGEECDDSNSGGGGQLDYQLYGVVLHSGSLRSGHYTAYVAVRPEAYYGENGGGNLERFLHLKPFVANIEHIVGVCWEEEQRRLQNQQQQTISGMIKQEEGMIGLLKEDHDDNQALGSHTLTQLDGQVVMDGGIPKQEEKMEHQQSTAMMMVTTDEDHLHYTSVNNVNGDHNYLGDGGNFGAASGAPSPSSSPFYRRAEVVGASIEQPPPQRLWYHISDTQVTQTSLAHVLRETTSPYMLFYERIH